MLRVITAMLFYPGRCCRDFFVLPEHYKDCESELVKRFGELVRKIWNARAFKGACYCVLCTAFFCLL